MENLINDKRHFGLYYKWGKYNLPLFYEGQEKSMMAANSKEKAILYLKWHRQKFHELNFNKKNYMQITFESFVRDPNPHIDLICNRFKTKRGKKFEKILKKEKIPREILSDGRDLPIYRRVNWTKTSASSSEIELNELYKWTIEGLSTNTKKALEWLIDDYNLFKNSIDD